MFGRRGDLPEPPPKGWEALGLRPGSTVKTFSDPTALDRYCETEIGRPASLYDPHARYGGECWVPRTHTLVMMDDKTARDPEMQAARRVHGNTHSWGLTHSGGDRDWIYPDRRPAQPISPSQAQMMIAMALAEQRKKPGLIGGQAAYGN